LILDLAIRVSDPFFAVLDMPQICDGFAQTRCWRISDGSAGIGSSEFALAGTESWQQLKAYSTYSLSAYSGRWLKHYEPPSAVHFFTAFTVKLPFRSSRPLILFQQMGNPQIGGTNSYQFLPSDCKR